MTRERTRHELRCFCSRGPLLAMYGLDHDGNLYVHVRIYKQNRVFGDILYIGGTVKIMCRECLRWHKVKIVQPNVAKLEETPVPVEVPPPPMFRPRPEMVGHK